jgi:hypothetical protein
MRIAAVIFAGSVAALTALATPALANRSDAATPIEDSASSSPCFAYQMGADGKWEQLPCQEAGAARKQPARKSMTRNGVEREAH